MRKLLFAVAFHLFMATTVAQPAKWYVSASTGLYWGGPKGTIKNKFEKTGYNHTAYSNFFGWESTIDYPHTVAGVPVMVRGGKKLKGNKSIFILAGTSAACEVQGFKKVGYESFVGLFSGDVGTTVSIKYKITEVAVGMEYALQNSKLKLGYAPALFLLRYFNYNSIDAGKKNAVAPGLALAARLPMGKEKRRMGVELVVDVNLAPPVTVKEQYHSITDNNGFAKEVEVFSATKVNMVHGMAGLALTLRKK